MFKELRWKVLLAVFKIKRVMDSWFGTRKLDYEAQSIYIRTRNIREYETRANSVHKEPKTVEWFENNSSENSVVYDVGANVGAYALIAASRGARVVAFEPSFQNAYALHENILLNTLDANVIVMPFILSSASGVSRFALEDTTFGASRGFVSKSESVGKAYPVMTLDAVIAQFALPLPTAIKIDVDGAEVDVLEGAQNTLQHSGLRSVHVEASDELAKNCERILVTAGFVKESEVRVDNRTVNYVYKRI